MQLAARMREEGRTGSIVTLCATRRALPESYYNPQWVADNIGDIAPWQAEIAGLVEAIKSQMKPIWLAGRVSIRGIGKIRIIQPMS